MQKETTVRERIPARTHPTTATGFRPDGGPCWAYNGNAVAVVEEEVPVVGWNEKAFPTALPTGRPASVEYEIEPVSFRIGVGENTETDVGLLLTLESDPLAESEIVTTS